MTPESYTYREAAQKLGCTDSNISVLVRKGSLVKAPDGVNDHGKTICRITAASLDAYRRERAGFSLGFGERPARQPEPGAALTPAPVPAAPLDPNAMIARMLDHAEQSERRILELVTAEAIQQVERDSLRRDWEALSGQLKQAQERIAKLEEDLEIARLELEEERRLHAPPAEVSTDNESRYLALFGPCGASRAAG